MIDVLNELYQEYGHCDNIKEGRRVIAIEDYQASLRKWSDGREKPIPLPKSKVVKLLLADGSWVAVRLRGNEPKMKVYKELQKTGMHSRCIFSFQAL